MATKFEVPSAAVLAQLPKRAFAFIQSVGTRAELLSALRKEGYTPEEHARGWALLLKAAGAEVSFAAPPREASAARAAMEALDAWDELGFLKAGGALGFRYPAQAEFLFHDLTASQGPIAVLGVAKFLDRLDMLETGAGRPAEVHDDDAKAIQLLAARGIDAKERARLRELVRAAQTEVLLPDVDAEGPHAAEREEVLTHLYAWYTEWSEVARAIVAKRSAKIALGLAHRKRSTARDAGAAGAVGMSDAQGAPGGAAPSTTTSIGHAIATPFAGDAITGS